MLAYAEQKNIVVFVPSYNNIKFYKKNLDSVFAQEYENYYVIYVDDASTDGTGDAVAHYIQERHLENKIFLIKNAQRRGAMYNHYIIGHSVPDDAIIATLDGDDWFPDTNRHVLARVNEAYQDPEVWMTYGQFEEFPSGKRGFCKALPEELKQFPVYRDYGWYTSHLRTYYAGLFKHIPVGYFIRDGNFLGATCDLAIMLALLELSGGRARFIDEILYTYNTINTNSDCYTRLWEQIHNDHWVRGRMQLVPLTMHPTDACKRDNIEHIYNIHISNGDIDACRTYCATLAVASVQKETVCIIHESISPETELAYQKLAHELDILVLSADGRSYKNTLLTYLQALPAESFVVITRDGCAWQSFGNLRNTVQLLKNTNAVAYSCIFGVSIKNDYVLESEVAQPAMTHIDNNYFVWKPASTQGSWHHPYASAALLMRKTMLEEQINRVRGATGKQLWSNLAQLAVDNADDVVLCTIIPPCVYQEIQ